MVNITFTYTCNTAKREQGRGGGDGAGEKWELRNKKRLVMKPKHHSKATAKAARTAYAPRRVRQRGRGGRGVQGGRGMSWGDVGQVTATLEKLSGQCGLSSRTAAAAATFQCTHTHTHSHTLTHTCTHICLLFHYCFGMFWTKRRQQQYI